MKKFSQFKRRTCIATILVAKFVIFTLFTGNAYSQSKESRVKAALIYNFIQFIEWENEKQLTTFNIGLLSSDTTVYAELNALSKRLKVRNKPISVISLSETSNMQNIQVLYVEQLHCQKLSEIYSLLTGRKVLLITERCTNRLFIMLNILYDSQTQTLSYEVNRQNMENEGFRVKPEILLHGGSFIDIKELYISTYNQLREETRKIAEFQEMLEAIKFEKELFEKQADNLNEQILELSDSKMVLEHEFSLLNDNLKVKDSILEIRSKELSNKVKESSSLQAKIRKQLELYSSSSESLASLNKEIELRNIELEEKQKSIESQKLILSEKETVIDVQKKLIRLSIALAVSLVLGFFMTFRAYRANRLLNIRLEKLVDERTKELQLSWEHFKNLFESSPISISDMNLSRLNQFINNLGTTTPEIIKIINENPLVVKQALQEIRINDVNTATLQLFGYPNKKAFIDSYKNTFIDQSLDDFKQTILSIIKKQRTFTYQSVRRTLNGEIIHILVRWVALPGLEEDYSRVIVSMADITELKNHRDHLEEMVEERSQRIIQLNRELTETVEELKNTVEVLQKTQEQLVRSEKMASLGMLSAGIAHEINNPINFISVSNQALSPLLEQLWDKVAMLNELAEKNQQKSSSDVIDIENELAEIHSSTKFLMDNINTGVKRTTEIISSLMSYSRTNEISFSQYDIKQGIKDALVILHSKYINRIVIVEHYDSIPSIWCINSSINQLVMNLLANAMDAIIEKGTINLKLAFNSEKNEVVFCVKDNGVGISESMMSKIFDPFYTTKDVGKGTGLGLYITYGIVQQHKGQIEVKSEFGIGSEFCVYLPVDPRKV